MLCTILLRPFVLPHSQQHYPVVRLLVSTFHPARSQPAAGRSMAMCSRRGSGELSRLRSCLLLPWHSAPAVQIFLWICWSTTVTASSSLFIHKQKKGAGPKHYNCITPPLAVFWLLGHWQCCNRYCSGLMRKQLFGSAGVASLMTQDWLYNLHLPTLLKVSTCLQGFSLGSCLPSLPLLSFWGIPRLFSMVSRIDSSPVWAWK